LIPGTNYDGIATTEALLRYLTHLRHRDNVNPTSSHAGDLEEYGTEVVVLSDHGSHPNIVAFYGAFYREDTLWVMLELCTGMTRCARTN